MSLVPHFPDRAVAVTPNDSTELCYATIYVGGGGVVAVEPVVGGNTVSFTVAAGTVLPVRCRRVLSTGTTATLIVAIT